MERVCRCSRHRLPEDLPLSPGEEATPEYVRSWGRHARSSPLYTSLVEVIASDEDLIGLLGEMVHTPRPNVLFAGVQYLLMTGEHEDLADFYLSLSPAPRPAEEAGPYFRDFALLNRDRLIEIGSTRYTQTNECRRCVALLPMIWRGGPSVFHLVDLGTSAGLNLALDKYSYQWGDLSWGEGTVRLDTEVRGARPVPRPIEVLSRTGLDLNPIDPGSEDDRVWLDALIWPEHVDRRARLRAAFDTVMHLDLEMVAGDFLESLPMVLGSLPDGEPAVVMNSFALIQLAPAQRTELRRSIGEARANRPVFTASMESEIEGAVGASLVVDGGTGPVTIGTAQAHGEWLELFEDQASP